MREARGVRIDWLKIAVTVAVLLTAVVLFAHLEARRQLRELPPIGHALSESERQEIENAYADED